MRQIMTELGSPPTLATIICEDNQATISKTKNPQFHGHAKHIAIKYHFIREQVKDGTVKLNYCPTEEMTADILTKDLSQDQFVKLRRMTGMVETPQHFVSK